MHLAKRTSTSNLQGFGLRRLSRKGRLVAISILAAGSFAGCASPPEFQKRLANPQDGVLVRWEPLKSPQRCRTSPPDEIVATGVFTLQVETDAIAVYHYEVAKYVAQQKRHYMGPSAFARTFLLSPPLVWLIPLDLLAAITHAGPIPIARALFALDEEWVDLPGSEDEHDVTKYDACGRRTSISVPVAGVACVVAVRDGSGATNRPLFLRKLRELSGTTDDTGKCNFDLRQLARELEAEGAGWTLTFSMFPGSVTNAAAPLILSAKQVRDLAELK